MKNKNIIIPEHLQSREEREKYLRAVNRMKEIKGFYIHLLIFITINLIQIGFNILYHHFGYVKIKINQYFLLIVWGIIVLIHAAIVFLPSFLFGKNWEEKNIKKIIDKDKF